MTPEEFRAAMTETGLTWAEIERLLGVSKRQLVNYRNGAYPVPLQTQILIRIMATKRGRSTVRSVAAELAAGAGTAALD